MKKPSLQISPLRLVKWCTQWQNKENWDKVPLKLRGVYVLYNGDSEKKFYNVVYVGMAASGAGIRRRLENHYFSKRKGDKWTHFSFFAVWPNIRNDEIRELEALIGEMFRKDQNAISLAKQKKSKAIQKVRCKKISEWPQCAL